MAEYGTAAPSHVPVSKTSRNVKRRAVGAGLLVLAVCLVVAAVRPASPIDLYSDIGVARLGSDKYLVEMADSSLEEAAQDVAKSKFESLILQRFDKLARGTYFSKGYDDAVLRRVAEEQIIYDRDSVNSVRWYVAHDISPHSNYPAVQALESRMLTHIMRCLNAEAVREVNQMIGADNGGPAKDSKRSHLLEHTSQILTHEVRWRIRAFLATRIGKAVDAGVNDVIDNLQKVINEQKQGELERGAPEHAPVHAEKSVKHTLAVGPLSKKASAAQAAQIEADEGHRVLPKHAQAKAAAPVAAQAAPAPGSAAAPAAGPGAAPAAGASAGAVGGHASLGVAASAGSGSASATTEEDHDHGPSIYALLAAAVILVVALGLIGFLSFHDH